MCQVSGPDGWREAGLHCARADSPLGTGAQTTSVWGRSFEPPGRHGDAPRAGGPLPRVVGRGVAVAGAASDTGQAGMVCRTGRGPRMEPWQHQRVCGEQRTWEQESGREEAGAPHGAGGRVTGTGLGPAKMRPSLGSQPELLL